jgi:hypothetical protein
MNRPEIINALREAIALLEAGDKAHGPSRPRAAARRAARVRRGPPHLPPGERSCLSTTA